MSIAQSCVAVIPCLNEEGTIAALVGEVRSFLDVVIVVDDGSNDGTAAKAIGAGAIVIRLPETSGKGAALTAGFRRARDLGFNWTLALDGDGQHAANDIPVFLSQAEGSSDVRMVVGNRMGQASKMPLLRRCVNRWMSKKLSRYCKHELPDSQCGFRLLHLDSWARFEFKAAHFEIESELIVRSVCAGLKVDFVPIQARYACERSKIHPLRDTVRWFKWWRAIRRELRARPSLDLASTVRSDLPAVALK